MGCPIREPGEPTELQTLFLNTAFYLWCIRVGLDPEDPASFRYFLGEEADQYEE